MKKTISILIYFTLIQTSIFAQDVEIQGNARVTGSIEVMDTIQFSDGTQLASACLAILQDGDGDTKITVQQNTDTDRIEFTSNGKVIAILDEANLRLYHKTNSIFIGEKSGSSDDGNNQNIFIGNRAGQENISGSGNIYMGTESGKDNQTGVQNTNIGHLSGVKASGSNNTYLGGMSGFANGGNQNTLIGHQAGETLRGDRNTVIGASAGATANGSGNVFIGASAAESMNVDNTLVIHNDDSNNPLIHGLFDKQELTFNADTKVEKVLSVTEEIHLLEQPLGTSRAVVFGREGEPNLGINTFNFSLPTPPFTSFSALQFGPVANETFEPTMSINSAGRVGIGILGAQTKLHVSSSSPSGHIMKIENTAPGIEGDGLEIKLNRPTNGAGNNFVTFTDEDGVAGRIEGFNIAEDIAFAAFPEIDFSDYFNIFTIENFMFDPGSLPTLSGGQLPTLSGGSFPNFTPGTFPNFNPGTFPNFNPGQLPSLSGGSFGTFSINAEFDADAFLANLWCGPACPNPQEFYTFEPSVTGASFPTLNAGQLPSLSGGQLPSLSGGQLPTLTGGSFPTINPGSFPTISGGELPSIDFDLIFNPPPLSTAFATLKEIMCWAIENGERSLLTTNPQDLRMMQNVSYLNNLAECKNGGVTYGSGGADYAEYLERANKEEQIKAGQIVGVKAGKISKNTEEAEQLLVISMMPVVLGNMPENIDSIGNYEKVAFLGQAPVWVVGKVQSGDYIIPSGNNDGYGLAVKPADIEPKHLSLIVGRSWSDGYNPLNLVNMAIGLKTNEISAIIQKQDEKMNDFEKRLAQLEEQFPIK